MAAPAALAVASTAASAGGSILSAFGAQQSGQAQSQMYAYQAGVARLNQQIALQNRDYTLATGETDAQRYGMQARARMGAIRAGIGASGIDIGSGSKADVQTGQETVTGIDMAQIRNNAARKAYGFEVEATQDVAQAGLYDMAAVQAKKAGDIKALGSLISGVGSVASKWYQGSSVGLFSGGSGDTEGAGP